MISEDPAGPVLPIVSANASPIFCQNGRYILWNFIHYLYTQPKNQGMQEGKSGLHMRRNNVLAIPADHVAVEFLSNRHNLCSELVPACINRCISSHLPVLQDVQLLVPYCGISFAIDTDGWTISLKPHNLLDPSVKFNWSSGAISEPILFMCCMPRIVTQLQY